jgi:predicted anti-sigma-YlaC factor YlaD
MAKKMTMDCVKGLALLSEYHDGTLGEEEQALMREHLASCPPCMIVFQDLKVIIVSAPAMREEEDIAFPDENAIWQRMRITGINLQ